MSKFFIINCFNYIKKKFKKFKKINLFFFFIKLQQNNLKLSKLNYLVDFLSIIQHCKTIIMNLLNIFLNFSRKTKIFNKSRYSRNRQNVRVTFYFGLYINIIVMYLVFGLFYNFTVLLSYNYWFYYFLLFSLLTSKLKIN